MSACNFQSKKTEGASSGAISKGGAEGEGFGGAEGEGFAGAEGEGFAGVIKSPKVRTLFVSSLTDIKAGSLVDLHGSNFVEGLQITVSGSSCDNVIFYNDSSLSCTLSADIPSVTSVTIQSPELKELSFQPEVISRDVDNDGVPDLIINLDPLMCPNGTCTEGNCATPTEVTWQDNTYAIYKYDPCMVDNCPSVRNVSQSDTDNDGIGDACDTDYAGDNPDEGTQNQRDLQDGMYDDLDSDGDGIQDRDDPYPDFDQNADSDWDGVPDLSDNCPFENNERQSDSDQDGTGDICDNNSDSDLDGFMDAVDTCPAIANPDQEYVEIDVDADRDGIPDNCGDTSIPSNAVVSKLISPASGELPNGTLLELRGENFSSAIKVFIYTNLMKSEQNCYWNSLDYICYKFDRHINSYYSECNVTTINPSTNTLFCELKSKIDLGNGTFILNASAVTKHSDGGLIYSNPILASPNSDQDSFDDLNDNCPSVANDQTDTDSDHLGDACDDTPYGIDTDKDGVFDYRDNCDGHVNPDQSDLNRNGLGDVCDFYTDGDNDGYYSRDNCPSVKNDQTDTDRDGLGDACDNTPQGTDSDKDGILDNFDSCMDVSNPEQADLDNDGIGDECDSISHPPAQVDSIVTPTSSSLQRGSLITLRGSNFVIGVTVLLFSTLDYSNNDVVTCTVTTITNPTELTCQTDYDIVNLASIVNIANPGSAGGECYPEILIQ